MFEFEIGELVKHCLFHDVYGFVTHKVNNPYGGERYKVKWFKNILYKDWIPPETLEKVE